MPRSHGAMRYLPRTSVDWIAFLFMVIMIQVICLFELFVVLNNIHFEYTADYFLHVLFGFFLYINVMSNMAFCMTTDATSGSVILPSILKEGWRFCSVCEANAPPRSFHCFFCNKCILRRDHHCVFTGNCIGHTNQRFYMGMIAYLCVGALYCNYLNVDYTWEVLGEVNLRTLFTMVLPLFAYVLGLLETFTFSVAFLSSLCVIGCCLLCALSFYHINNILNGQTTFERSRGIRKYNYGWRENLRQVFGERWPVAWLSPFIKSPLPCDGLDFPLKEHIENIKQM